MIVTEPGEDGFLATVSVTSLKGAKDQTVILRMAEHPFIKWDSSVSYAHAQVTSVSVLEDHLNIGLAKMHRDMDQGLVQLLFDGFLASEYTKKRVQEFVREYKIRRSKS